MSRTNQHPLLTAVDRVIPQLAPMLAATDENRCLPDPVVDLMRAAGVFRMAVPAEYGGWEADPLVQLRAVEALSELDASVGWYAMIGSDGGYYSAFLEPDVAKRIFASDPDIVTAGFVDPAGVARATTNGYLVSGRWPFGSASRHSSWMASGCRVIAEDGTTSRPMVAMLPADECTIHDTWHSIGLRGSGSFDYSASDLSVPREMTFSFDDPPRRSEPLYRFPLMYRANVPGVPLGVARATLRTFVDEVAGGRDSTTGRPRAEGPHVQRAVGLAEAMIGSARAFAVDVLGELWSTLQSGDDPGPDLRMRFRLMIAHTGLTCRQAVQELFTVSGGSAVYDRHPLQRRMRDAITIAQHMLHDERVYVAAGQARLGLPVTPVAFR